MIIHENAVQSDREYTNDTASEERVAKLKPVERQHAYLADITYGTNNEFGFDYLRANMVPDKQYLVQRPFYYALVDEVDSILIDEARTPLIISGPAEQSTERYRQFSELVAGLEIGTDYIVDEKMRSSILTESGVSKMEQWLHLGSLYNAGGLDLVHHLEKPSKGSTVFTHEKG